MKKYNMLYEMADSIFDANMVYWWTEKHFVIWSCHGVRPGPVIIQ